jgi:vacuolar-type H+-ATPase subunit F/Vma7
VPDFYFIGEEELLVAFRLVGVEGCAVTGREEALEAFQTATGQGPADTTAAAKGPAKRESQRPKILILSSAIAGLLDEETSDWQFSGEYPLIVEIPSPGKSPDEGRSLVSAIREAVGISI